MPSSEFERFMELLKVNAARMSAQMSIEEQRRGLEQMVAAMHPAPSFATYVPIEFENVRAEVTSVAQIKPAKVVLYLHGGAFKMGSAAQDRHLTAHMAKQTGANVVAVDYALAPENKFPVALEQCILAYRGLLSAGYSADDIVIMGVSAGGTLALATVLALRDRGAALPRAVVAISPATYLDSVDGTHTTNRASDVVLGNDEDTASAVLALYAPDEDPRNPYISPLYGDYSGIRPLLVVVGTDEILHDDSLRLAEKATASGAEVELITGEGMPHAYPVFLGAFPEADATFDNICEYVSRKLAG